MESTRPPIQSVQRRFILVVLVGLILGCALGAGLVGIYIRLNPPVYAGGSHPNELTQNYQDHYLSMVIDSYIIRRQVTDAQERLKSFDEATKIRALGQWSAAYVAAGRAPEAQAINELAVALKDADGWNPETISTVAAELANEFQEDSAKSQAITTFANALGQVPVVSDQVAEPEQAAEPAPAESAPAGGGGLATWQLALLCCLGLVLIALIAFVVYRRLGGRQQAAAKPEAVWEGEGPAPIKQWSGTYTLGQDNYDEFFTIETTDGAFLGESGIGILEVVPNTSPKQVMAFDVGLFDKTDITTLSRVVMSEHAYNDQAIRSKVEENPQAEAVLAQPGSSFTLETSALQVDATIEELVYGGGNVYFEKLKMKLDVFIKEGVDLRIGTMDVPDEYKI